MTRRKAFPSLVEKAARAQRESKQIDFKEHFDTDSEAEWLELLKDIAAMANSGGGAIVVGVANNGAPSGQSVDKLLVLDSAKLTDHVFRYTAVQFDAFELHRSQRNGVATAILVIGTVESPLVFTNPGTYAVGPNQQKTAFARGTVYWRHGAKSEPATSVDLAAFITRRVEQLRRSWLSGIRRVVSAAPGTEVRVFQRAESDDQGHPTQIRLTDDPAAPVFGRLHPDKTHPFRQKELLREINARLAKGSLVNSYDLQALKRVHKIDQKSRPEFCHLPKFGTLQYSEAFVEWITTQYRKNKRFIASARRIDYEQRHR